MELRSNGRKVKNEILPLLLATSFSRPLPQMVPEKSPTLHLASDFKGTMKSDSRCTAEKNREGVSREGGDGDFDGKMVIAGEKEYCNDE